jgi:hypothetical protein
MNIGLRSLAALTLMALLTGCASMQPQDFAKSPTHFELDTYFVGHARSWGVFENSEGQPHKSFVCDSYGRRTGKGEIHLHQDFAFSTGKKQTRDWTIRKTDATHWEATANDMVGVARGHGEGNAFYWEYDITLNSKNPLATVHVRQWMYLVEGTDILMTHLVITKMGITVAEVSETIRKVKN